MFSVASWRIRSSVRSCGRNKNEVVHLRPGLTLFCSYYEFTKNWSSLAPKFKNAFQIELARARSANVCFCCLLAPFVATSCTHHAQCFRVTGALSPWKGQGFLEPGALDSPNVVSHFVWGHWRFRDVVFSQIGRPLINFEIILEMLSWCCIS